MFTLGVLGAFLFAAAPIRAHDTEPVKPSFKITDDGVVKFTEDVVIREVILKKGIYVIEHRLDRNLHVLTFTRISAERNNRHVVEDRKDVVAASVVSAGTVRHSSVEAIEQKDGVVRIQSIQLAWENALHSF